MSRRIGLALLAGMALAAGCGQEPACNRESHSGPERRLTCGASAVEALEEVFELARVEPRAVVRHGDTQTVRFHAGMHQDLLLGRRVLRRVLEQV